MTLRARRLWIATGAIAWWLVSCRDLAPPAGGVVSVSRVLLPSPSVVVGDTMRDSTGLVAPLRVIAFGEKGDTVANPTTSFIVLDTGAHLSGALFVGDKADRTVRVVGSVEGLQTRPESVKVTLSPDTLVAADSVVHHRVYSVPGDSAFGSAEVATVVSHVGGGPVPGVIVRYTPGQVNARVRQTLVNGTVPSDRDTTDAAGRTSRTLRVQTGKRVTGQGDTTSVTATASYKGKLIGRVIFTLIFAMP